ncbi:AsmA-like C-terminal region-containing protein [Hyphomicrobium sp. D-2]|uniref:YhdP family protein n=1 Tax=Hyphomicrobium sp. D-2 TaxID=3041621 RepID=UPI0024571012|nr:AsmA-like C-terminal region-containing protein [Hyphomicrobium sp. D-2]MDH4982688.1 AsmA-like C-terminal region-containing protein [Hyphomicrobium sp. D-2]
MTAAVACDHVLHGVGRVVFILAPVLILVLLVVGLGYVRLSHGPISLKFLVEPIEQGINAELAGNRVRIDDAVVSLSGTGGLEFRLRNIRVHEADGDVVASAPSAAVELSTQALWSMRVVPARIELIEPRLFLFYSEDGGLALSFSKVEVEDGDGSEAGDGAAARTDASARRDGQLAAVPTQPTQRLQAPAAATAAETSGPLKRIDLARVITDMSSRARQRLDATSFLREFGLRNATVLVESGGQTTEWRVPSLTVGLVHARTRSVISGSASIAAVGGLPWQVKFETDEREHNRTLAIKASISDLTPRTIANALPQLSLLHALDLPVDGEARLELTSDGDLRTAALQVTLGAGSLRLPALPEAPLDIDGGLIRLSYDGVAEKISLLPSTLRWRGSRVTVEGGAKMVDENAQHPVWDFDVGARDGVLAADEFKVAPVALERWTARGRVIPHSGEVDISDFSLRAGGAEITLKGNLVAGDEPASTRLEGGFGEMPLGTLKALWPKAVAPGAREWVGEQVDRGTILGGSFRFLSGTHMLPDQDVGPEQHQLSFSMDVADLEMRVLDALPPVAVPRATLRIENDALEANVPEGSIVLGEGRGVPLQAGRFTAVGIMNEVPTGEIAFASQSALADIITLLERSPVTFLDDTGLPRDGIEGKVDAKFKIGLPLLADLPASAVKVEGKARISDGRIKQFLGAYQVQSASFDIDITEKAAGASGQMLVNGVLAKLAWQRIFDAELDKQPPLRVKAVLDNADRVHLGLDINDMVQGDVPIELTVKLLENADPVVQLHADLSGAELTIDGVAWRKPAGRPARLQSDIAKGTKYKTELQNFKVAGDDIAIEGWAAIDADNRLREFYFPDFSLNVVTRMEVRGTRGSDDVWKIKAKGPTLDGRDFFRALFSLDQLAEQQAAKKQKSQEGIDIEAEINNIIGFREVGYRSVKVTASKRGEKLAALDVRGTLDGGKPLAVTLRNESGQRKLLADSTDAGQAFKLIDFYPNIQGGRVRLEVNLDGSGAAEKTGTLWVENFRILGDPVVAEVFSSSADDGRPAIEGTGRRQGKRVTREVFDFSLMRVLFSVGYGQFVMNDAQLRGPLLGATMRGKVDFTMRRMNLGGTYVPLQGLNSALCEIPLVGQIITGPKCEGISGMTFAIQGSMDRPEVIVNPLSMLAPGIFRDIFQMTPFNPKVQRRDDMGGNVGGGAKASSTVGGGLDTGDVTAAPGTVVGRETVDGWSSQTVAPPVRRR